MVKPARRRYSEVDADNDRWDGFEFRAGDIIISAPSKSGTTWTQLLVALVLFDGPDFPGAVSEMSPWMDQKIRSKEAAHAVFDNQGHRRFIKTHTPLDGLPFGPEITYVCVGRDPRDAAVSLIHHRANMRPGRFRELLAMHSDEPPPEPAADEEFDETAYFDRFIDNDDEGPNWSLRFLAHHYQTFWDHRHLPNVGLFHFSDYLADLPGEIERLAELLEADLRPERAKDLANEATLERARERATEVAPEANVDLWRDPAAFFRSGTAGEWRDRMTREQQHRYAERVGDLMPADLAGWVHDGGTAD